MMRFYAALVFLALAAGIRSAPPKFSPAQELRELCENFIGKQSQSFFKMQEEEEFKIGFSMENIKPEEVKVTIENSRLLVNVHHEEKKDGQVVSTFSLNNIQWRLPENGDLDNAKCEFHPNGTLEVLVPRKADFAGDRNKLRVLNCDPKNQLGQDNLVLVKMEEKKFELQLELANIKPEEINVTIKDDGKVWVDAEHYEIINGKKVLSYKMNGFNAEIPENVNLDKAKCWIYPKGFESKVLVTIPRKDDFKGDLKKERPVKCQYKME